MSSGGHEIPRYLFELGLLGVDLSQIIRIHQDVISILWNTVHTVYDTLLNLEHKAN